MKNKQNNVKLSEKIPHKTAIGYKVFYLKDGKLYPPMVKNPGGSDTPMNVWIDASAGDITTYSKTGRPQIEKGGEGTHCSTGLLAYRPGWHLGTVPIAKQFEKINPLNGKKELFPREFVWAECEYACDVDYQEKAMKEGMTENGKFRHSYAGLKELPKNGFYRYRTNPDPNTEEWIITGQIRVKRILSNKEVDEICRKNHRVPQKRELSANELEEIFAKEYFMPVSHMRDSGNSLDKCTAILEQLVEQKQMSLSDAKLLKKCWKENGALITSQNFSVRMQLYQLVHADLFDNNGFTKIPIQKHKNEMEIER